MKTFGFAISAPYKPLSADEICLRRERVGKELAIRQPALSNEVAPRSVDHRRRTACVDLKRRKIGQIVHYRAMNESRATLPRVLGLRLRQYGDIPEIRLLARPLLGKLAHVQIGQRACTPVQVHLARWLVGFIAIYPFVEYMLCDRLDRSKSSSTRKQHDRTGIVFTQKKRAERRFDAQDVALLDRRFDCAE